MLDVNTLVVVLLVVFIAVDLVNMYTNSVIVTRNYKVKDDEIDSWKRAYDESRAENRRLIAKVKDLSYLMMDGGKTQAYLIDNRGLTLVTPETYRIITTPKEGSKGEEI